MIFQNEAKTDVILFRYPTYTLYGRIRVKDVDKYKETLDDSLIIYRHCINERSIPIPDYKSIWEKDRMAQNKQYLQHRLAKGYKST